jgi:hypothetical protein
MVSSCLLRRLVGVVEPAPERGAATDGSGAEEEGRLGMALLDMVFMVE